MKTVETSTPGQSSAPDYGPYDTVRRAQDTMVDTSAIKSLFRLMRPNQWIKNGFVLTPIIFSSRLTNPEDLFAVFTLFVAFCLASSATYIFNDYMDLEQDKHHPQKKKRPLASGAVSPTAALIAMGVLVCGVFAVATLGGASIQCQAFLVAYLILQVLYCVFLKDVVILDVLALSTGFLLRILGGAAVINVSVSSWIILCAFALSILLALGKRRHEVVILGEEAALHRPVLANYNVRLLDQLLQVVTTSTFIFYCLYCVKGNPGVGIESEKMMFTIPLVTYGIFRYLYLIYLKQDGGSPTALLLTDPPLLACGLLWLTACIAIIYF